MAIHANSTPVPARPLLGPEALPSGGLLPARRAELLAILDAGPLPHAFMTRQQHEAVQAGVDALIDYLDATTPDADLEPSLGAPEMPASCLGVRFIHGEGWHTVPLTWATGSTEDCEEEDEHGSDEDAGEPSLGAPEIDFSERTGRIAHRGHIDQRQWADGEHAASGLDVDRERDTSGDEPTLGAPEHMMSLRYGHGVDRVCDQTWWARGGDVDERENVSEDEGACILSQRHDEEHDEPSLGAPEIHHDQRRWAQGRFSRELDHDERAGLRSWGTYNETRLRVEQCRRDTEAMLRRKRLVRADMDEVRIIVPGIAEFRGMRL